MRRRSRRGLAALATLAVIAAAPAHAVAQFADVEEEDAQPRGKKRFIYAAVGAAFSILPGMFAEQGSGQGPCTSRTCAVTLGGLLGGALGFMIGSEHDAADARTRIYGPEFSPRSRSIDLPFGPQTVVPYRGGSIVLGDVGAAVVDRERVGLRASQIRGITSAVGLPSADVVVLGSPRGLYAFPLRDRNADGRLLLEGSATALAAPGREEIYVGGTTLRRASLSGSGAALEAVPVTETAPGDHVAALALDASARTLWSLEGDRLVARDPSTLASMGTLTLPTPGRTLAVERGRAVVAAGNGGVFLVDIGNPARPALLGHIATPVFVYAAALVGRDLYAAAGPAGLLLYDVSDPAAAQLVGRARMFGFAAGVAVGPDGRIYVADRAGQRLSILEPRS